MFNKILEYIKQYNSIVISRHNRPDLDALGSQLGLKEIIKTNFKDKEVYAVGDMNRPCFLGEMDNVSDEKLSKSLVIFVDVSVKELLPNFNYEKAATIICIDHHKNECNIPNALAFYDKEAAAACQIVADFAFNNNLVINEHAATCLYSGIVGDTNRFNFSLSGDLLRTTAKLIDLGFDYKSIYNIIYNEKVSNIKMKAYFMDKFIVDDYGLAYIKSDSSIFDKFKVDLFTISRGMINVMSNLEGVEIWANFTEDKDTNKIACEFRSKSIKVIEIAKKYGGGGHDLACGCSVSDFKVVDEIIKDLDNLLKERA